MNLGLVLFSGARQPQSCKTPPECLGDALGLAEVCWEQWSSWSCCSGDSHMWRLRCALHKPSLWLGLSLPALGAALHTASAAATHCISVQTSRAFSPPSLSPSLPPEMFFAKTDCSNDVNPISLPVPHLSSSLFLFAMLKWRYPESAKVGSALATFRFLCLPGSRDGDEVLVLGPVSPAAAWGCVICSWKSAVLVQFLPEDPPLCLSGLWGTQPCAKHTWCPGWAGYSYRVLCVLSAL